MEAPQKHQAWEYCIISTPPPGPVEVYVTRHTLKGMERERYVAKSWDDGNQRLFPQIVAKMGLEGWELVFVDQAGSYYMRRQLFDMPPDS